MKKTLVLTILSILLVMLAACNQTPTVDDNKAAETGVESGSSEVSMELYVMSQCPYGVQAENELAPVVEKLGSDLNFNLHFIGGGSPGSFQSLHGQPEVDGNKIQLCAMKHHPGKYYNFISCMNKEYQKIPNNWEDCAKELDLDSEKLKNCFDDGEGDKLLESSFKKSQDAGAMGSPTIVINGKTYSGKRDTNSVFRALCKEYETKPEACADIPEPVKFTVTILNDKECSDCNTGAFEANLQQLFEAVTFERVDISSGAGKELAEKYGVEKLPAFLFDKKVDESAPWKSEPRLASLFDAKDDVYKLKDEVTGATRFVDSEKQAEYEALLAEKKKESLKKLGIDSKPQIDFFVMSYCPYGNQAEELIKPAYDKFKGKAEFKPRYVIYKNYQGGSADYCIGELCSMHGIQELNQNIRELCVADLYSMDEWFEFAMAMNKDCDYKNADSCWQDVAKKLDLDTDKIAACQKDEGESLIAEQFELNELLGVQGSPAVFVQGEEYNGPRSAEGYQKALCNVFDEEPAECEGLPEISSAPSAPAPAGGCGG